MIGDLVMAMAVLGMVWLLLMIAFTVLALVWLIEQRGAQRAAQRPSAPVVRLADHRHPLGPAA